MAVGADLAIDIKVVQENKFARELVMVGSDAFGKKAQRRIAVAFGHIPENLVVRPILFYDVNAILKRTWLAAFRWDRTFGRFGTGTSRCVLRKSRVGLGGIGF